METKFFKEKSELGLGEVKKSSPLFKVVTFIAIIGVVGTFIFYKQASDLKANPNKIAQDEAAALIAKVGVLIVLPTNETPTIATVTDPAPLKSQPFFANAQTGDKVLIYTNARKAILYSPISNKIVEVAPINIGPTGGAPTAPAAPAKK